MKLRNTFALVHRWLGLPLGVLFLITFLSGFILAVDEMVARFAITDPQLNEAQSVFSALSAVEKGKKLNELLSEYNTAQSVSFPSEFQPYWLVRVNRIEFAHHPLTLIALQRTDDDGAFINWVLNLHKHYLLGRDGLFSLSGKYYVAWVGLLSLVLSLLGVCLWWRLRKSFDVKKLLPRGKKRQYFYYSHMHLGVVVLLAIIGLSLTGAGMAYREIAESLLINKDSAPLMAKTTESWVQTEPQNEWPQRLSLAVNQFETARLVSVRMPRAGSEIFEIKLISDHGWGLPINAVLYDKQGLVAVRDAQAMANPEWLYYAMTALHTGRNLPVYYVSILCVFSLLSVVMLLSALLSFIKKKRKNNRRLRIAEFLKLRTAQ